MKLKSNSKKWNKEVGNHFNKELIKLQRMNTQAAEYSIQRNYLDLMLDLPWNEYSKDNFSLNNAQKHQTFSVPNQRIAICTIL